MGYYLLIIKLKLIIHANLLWVQEQLYCSVAHPAGHRHFFISLQILYVYVQYVTNKRLEFFILNHGLNVFKQDKAVV